jgi:hypothetical protein
VAINEAGEVKIWFLLSALSMSIVGRQLELDLPQGSNARHAPLTQIKCEIDLWPKLSARWR